MPNAIARMIGELRDVGGLKGTDVANVVAVSPATVSRWQAGTASPQPKTELLLADLRYVVSRLADFYTADETRIWLYSKHRLLNDARPIELIHQNKADEVLSIIESLDQGAFT